MTNKEKYIKTFSGVEPSDEIKERILNMTTKRKYSLRALVTVLAVLMLVAIAMITANAATDGELGEKIGEISKAVSDKVVILFNGEEIPVEVERTETIDENGEKRVEDTIYLPDVANSEAGAKIVYRLNNSTEDIAELTIKEYDENGEVDTFKYEITHKTESK